MKPALVCLLSFCVVLAGCGGAAKSSSQASTSPGANAPAVDSPTPIPAPGAPPTSSPTPPPSASPPPAAPDPAPAPAPQPAHVILVVEENRSYSTVYPSGMPYLSALGDAYGIATNYVSDEPGSLLDYLWLSSGSGEENFGCNGDGCTQPITDDNIFREINQNGLSWKVYADSLPAAGFMGHSAGNYVRRHNPAAWYSDVINDSTQQQNMVPFSQFATDVGANNLPNYSIIIPDLQHDSHDGTIAAADAWLQQNIGPALDSSYFQPGGDGVMFITFDNGDGDAQGQVFMAVIGSRVIPGIKVQTAYRHEDTLRTIMDLLLLTHLPGASATAAPMSEFFQQDSPDD